MVKPEYWREPNAPRTHRLATPIDAREYLDRRENMKYAFGMPLDKAAERYRFTAEGGLYTISDSRRGLREASTLAELSQGVNAPQCVASLYEGVGNTSWCLATAFGPTVSVSAVESDMESYLFAKYNLDKDGLLGQVTVYPRNVFTFLQNSELQRVRFRAMFLDPPWPVNFFAKGSFTLEDLDAPTEALLTGAAQLSPVIGLRLPDRLDPEEVQGLGDLIKRHTIVHSHHIDGEDPVFNTKAAYFVEGDPHLSISEFTLIDPYDNSTWIRRDIT